MAPLFTAVAHGCQAGRHQDALDEVYYGWIHRGREAFSLKKLGAFSGDLAALSGFFDSPWSRPVAGLSQDSKGFVLSEVGFDLRALGRLAEAVQPMKGALQERIAEEIWDNAATNAGNLSELYLTIGDTGQAVQFAEKSVDFAERSGDAFQRMSQRTTLADALHQAGRLAEAEVLFDEAEEIQKKE
jgi:tetratricopeptide (TPR) repeat protein